MSQEKLAHKNRLASSAGGRVEESRPGRLSCMAGFAPTRMPLLRGPLRGPLNRTATILSVRGPSYACYQRQVPSPFGFSSPITVER
jgi:hypothetical protein